MPVLGKRKEFILDQLSIHSDNYKKFWETIREVVPTGKSNSKQDILLHDGNRKLDRSQVA